MMADTDVTIQTVEPKVFCRNVLRSRSVVSTNHARFPVAARRAGSEEAL
jgi:hypothetical protein